MKVRGSLFVWFLVSFSTSLIVLVYSIKQFSVRGAHKGHVYVTVTQKGRFGNNLFEYAALRDTAFTNRMIPVIGGHLYLKDIFNISITSCSSLSTGSNSSIVKEIPTDVNETLAILSNLPWRDVTLSGYFQSYRYFESVKDDIRREFTFKPDILQRTNETFRRATPTDWEGQRYVRVGMHVRRGDMLKKKWRRIGFDFPNTSYFERAMEYFTQRYDRDQFLVASLDIEWCKIQLTEYALSLKAKIHFLSGDAVEDMSTLTSCDHVIVTIGTYSWWVGWLNRGLTVYPKEYPPTNTWSGNVHKPEWYYPNDTYNTWIAK